MTERTPEQLALFARQRENQASHRLYTDDDPDKPAGACDRNGELVLGVCRLCGTYEAGLEDARCPGPKVTTRPLFWLAHRYGADYTDVLHVADGIKALITGGEVREAWFPPALERICDTRFISGRDEPPLYHAIQQHVTEFVALQGSALRPQTKPDFDVIPSKPAPEFPDDPHCSDV